MDPQPLYRARAELLEFLQQEDTTALSDDASVALGKSHMLLSVAIQHIERATQERHD